MKLTLIVATITLLVGGIIGYKLAPQPTLSTDTEKTTKDVTTVVVEKKRPDGTTETTTTITDKSKESKSVTIALPVVKPDWHVSVSASAASVSAISSPIYGLQLERRLLGNLMGGIRVATDKQVGIVVGYEW